MSDLPVVTLEWLADHHGVISRRALRAHGVGDATIARLIEAGVLRRVAKSVYVIASAPSTLEQRCAIVSTAHPRGFVTGPTAGKLAGLRRMPFQSPVHFTVRHGAHLDDVPGVEWRQTRAILPSDRFVRDDGIALVSWPRLAFDLAADLRQLDHISVVNQLLDTGRVSIEVLQATDRRLGRPARPGSGVFRRTLEAIAGRLPNQSHPEVLLADALRRRGVPVEHQVEFVRPSDGRQLHVDLAVPAARWGIELDIHPEHRSLEGHAEDARRRRQLHHSNWQVEVVAEHDLADIEALADELAALYRLRSRQVVRWSVS